MALAVLATTNAPAGFAPPAGPPVKATGVFQCFALNSAQFADSITIDMLDVNLLEYKDAD